MVKGIRKRDISEMTKIANIGAPASCSGSILANCAHKTGERFSDQASAGVFNSDMSCGQQYQYQAYESLGPLWASCAGKE